jgi:phosphoribosylanthranilate isomerase
MYAFFSKESCNTSDFVIILRVGGLNAENVREAIEIVQPYGLDICSGVRSNGKLDEEKLKRFFVVSNNYLLH